MVLNMTGRSEMAWRTLAMVLLLTQRFGNDARVSKAGQEQAQTATPLESTISLPSQAYQYAVQPLQDARKSPDDLTEAEKWALLVAKKRAATACDQFLGRPEQVDGEELLPLGQLCLTGDNALAAREALQRYLELPKPGSRREAMLLLSRAQVRVGAITEAVRSGEKILEEYGFDTESDDAISYVIDGAEARDVTLQIGLEMAERRMPSIWTVLERFGTSSALTEDSKFSASQLFEEGLTLCSLYRQTEQLEKMKGCVEKLRAFPGDKRWEGAYDSARMREALRRFESVGEVSPVPRLRAFVLETNGAQKPAAISLRTGRVALFLFTLATPSTVRSWGNLHTILQQAQGKPVNAFAITTYALNGGISKEDKEEVEKGLSLLRSRLVPASSMYLGNESDLDSFALDSYPSVVVLFDGKVVYCSAFGDSAGEAGELTRAIAPAGKGNKKETLPSKHMATWLAQNEGERAALP